MTLRTFLPLAALLALAACDADARGTATRGVDARGEHAPAHAIAGHWSQVTGTADRGMTLEFDDDTDKMLVHTAPDADGGHEHRSGTYTFDAASGAVSVRCNLGGDGRSDSWSGTLQDGRLTLTAGPNSLRFERGGDPHTKK